MKKSIAISIFLYILIMVVTCIVPLSLVLKNAKYEAENAVVNFVPKTEVENAYQQLINTDEVTKTNFSKVLEHYNNIIKFEKNNFITLSIYFSIIVNILTIVIGLLIKKKNKIIGFTILLAGLISLIIFIICTFYFVNNIMVI